MALTRREQLIWDLLANDQASQAFRDVGDAMGVTEEQGESLLATVGKFVTFGLVANQVWEMTRAASDLSEAINLNERIFGSNSEAIQEWAADGADAFGLSQAAALEFSAQIGGALQNLGYDMDEASTATQSLIERAADMASAFNKDVTQAIFAVQAGLRGETEPLRQFNVFLDDTRIKAEAAAMGLYSGSGAIDRYAKAQAIASLIMKDTAQIAGDFELTADGLANSQRRLAAHTENLKTSMGQAFLPVVEAAFGAFNGLLTAANDMNPVIGQTAVTFALVGAAALVLKSKVGDLWRSLSGGLGGKAGLVGAFKAVAVNAALTAAAMAGMKMFQAKSEFDALTDASEGFGKAMRDMDLATLGGEIEKMGLVLEGLQEEFDRSKAAAEDTFGLSTLGPMIDAIGKAGLSLKGLTDEQMAAAEAAGIHFNWLDEYLNPAKRSAAIEAHELELAEERLAEGQKRAALMAEEQRLATEKLGNDLGTSQSAAEDLTGIIAELQAAFDQGKSAADVFRKAIERITDEFFSARSAEHEYQAAIDELTESINAAKEAHVGHQEVLSGTEREGRAVQDSIEGMMDSIIAVTAETYKQAESSSEAATAHERGAEAADAAKAKFQELHNQALVQLQQGFGITAEQAEVLLGRMEDYNVLELIEKFAIVNNEASGPLEDAETDARAWENLELTQKQLEVDNAPATGPLRDAIIMTGNWDAWGPRVPSLHVDSTPATESISQALSYGHGWDIWSPNVQQVMANTLPATGPLRDAIIMGGNWDQWDPNRPNVDVNEQPAVESINVAQGFAADWDTWGPNRPTLDVNEQPAVTGMDRAQGEVAYWDRARPNRHTVDVNENPAVSGIRYARNTGRSWDGWHPPLKRLRTSSNAYDTSRIARSYMTGVPNVNRNIRVSHNGWSAARDARNAMYSVPSNLIRRITVGISPYIAARAEGGPVKAGHPYLVGERGPEVIVPERDGRVLSNDDMRSLTPKTTGGGAAVGASTVPIVLQLDSKVVWRGMVDLKRRQGTALGLS